MRRSAVLAVAALTMALVQASPAGASTTGTVVFHCTMQAPAWPTAQANGTCGAGVNAAAVSVTGTDDIGVVYALAGHGDVSMAFTYQTSCIASTPPLLWNAVGVIQVDDVPAVWGGLRTTATLTADVAINGFPGGFTFVTTGHDVGFAHGATATGFQGRGEATTAFVYTSSNVCPEGGPITSVVDGRWTLVM